MGQHCEQAICDVVYFSLWVSIVSRQYVMLSIVQFGCILSGLSCIGMVDANDRPNKGTEHRL